MSKTVLNIPWPNRLYFYGRTGGASVAELTCTQNSHFIYLFGSSHVVWFHHGPYKICILTDCRGFGWLQLQARHELNYTYTGLPNNTLPKSKLVLKVYLFTFCSFTAVSIWIPTTEYRFCILHIDVLLFFHCAWAVNIHFHSLLIFGGSDVQCFCLCADDYKRKWTTFNGNTCLPQ